MSEQERILRKVLKMAEELGMSKKDLAEHAGNAMAAKSLAIPLARIAGVKADDFAKAIWDKEANDKYEDEFNKAGIKYGEEKEAEEAEDDIDALLAKLAKLKGKLKK